MYIGVCVCVVYTVCLFYCILFLFATILGNKDVHIDELCH